MSNVMQYLVERLAEAVRNHDPMVMDDCPTTQHIDFVGDDGDIRFRSATSLGFNVREVFTPTELLDKIRFLLDETWFDAATCRELIDVVRWYYHTFG